MEKKWTVAFLCRENSCRSQLAEALAKRVASDVMEVYSAGMRPIDRIDPGAVRALKQTHGIDMLAEGQWPKTVGELPAVDIIVYMGCRVECARHACQVSLGWDIADPKGGTEEDYRRTITEIEQNILQLGRDIHSGRIHQWKKENFNISFPTVFPFWGEMTAAQQEQIRTGWRTELFPQKKQIYETADGCKGVMIVRKGCLRIYMLSPEGREVSLYRLLPGDICVLSAACLMEEIDFDILIEAAEYTEVATIPAADIQKILPQNEAFQNYLYKKAAERFADVMWTVQQILFKRIDQRIARYLWDEMNLTHSTTIRVTHDHIAREICSAREVVSKTLRHMTEDGVIEARYGKIEITDLKKLRSLL